LTFRFIPDAGTLVSLQEHPPGSRLITGLKGLIFNHLKLKVYTI
jgi:hypothetical protein